MGLGASVTRATGATISPKRLHSSWSNKSASDNRSLRRDPGGDTRPRKRDRPTAGDLHRSDFQR
jgi:hypothetical protein